MELKTGEAIHCHTKELAQLVLAKLHNQGIKWSNDKPISEDTGWGIYTNNTCYGLNKEGLTYSSLSFYEEEKYRIVEAEEFLSKQSMKTYKLIKKYPGSVEIGEITQEDMSKYPEYWEELKYQIGDIVLVQTYYECGEGNGITQDSNICEIVVPQKASGLFDNEADFYVKPLNYEGVYKVRTNHIIRRATQEEILKAKIIVIGKYEVIKRWDYYKIGCQNISKSEVECIERLITNPINAKITIHGTEISQQLIQKIKNL